MSERLQSVSRSLDDVLRTLASAWKLTLKRSLAYWRLLLSVLIGVVLASAILSGTVVYFDALRELALKTTLAKHTVTKLDILLQVGGVEPSREEHTRLSGLIEAGIDSHVAWLLRDRLSGGRSPTFFLATPGNEDRAGDDNARTYFAFVPRLDEHVTLLSGTRPSSGRLNSPDGPLEIGAIVPVEAAHAYGAVVGDRLVAVPVKRDVAPYVTVVISGLFQRNQTTDAEFQYLEESALQKASGPGFRTVPFFVDESTFLDTLGPAFRRMEVNYAWLLQTDPSRLTARTSEDAVRSIDALGRSLAATLPSYGQSTSLDNALADYDRRLFFSKLAMFVVLFLIAIVILYYVVSLASLAVETRKHEVALLRSRGASPGQVLLAFALEGATLAVVAAAVAPLLAASSVSLLGFTPAFEDITGGARLDVSISWGAYGLSTLGGVLSFVALIIPAAQATRTEVVRQRQRAARPSTVPAFQRYYLDLLLLLVAIFLARQLSEQGSLVATSVFGEATADELLLAVPGLILVASAMVLLRLFPLAMRLVSRATSAGLPAGPVMGVWQMARDPAHYARLSLLLILTAGLGIFASSFGATLQHSFDERVFHATGGDVRIERVQPVDQAGRPREFPVSEADAETLALVRAYEEVPGTGKATPVRVTAGKVAVEGADSSFRLFAIDGDSFDEVAFFRDDYADQPIDGLLDSLEITDPPEGLRVPNDAVSLGVLLKADKLSPTVRLTARFRDAEGRFSNHTLGTLSSKEWLRLEASLLTSRQAAPLTRPLSLVSLYLEETGLDRRLQPGSILVDEITVTTEAGETRVVEGFDDTSSWRVLKATGEAASDDLRPAEAVFDRQAGSIVFFWSAGGPLTARGIYYSPELPPLPVLVSDSLAEAVERSPGDEFEIDVEGSRVPVRLTGTLNLFPTVTTLDQRFLVADLAALNRYSNLGAVGTLLYPVEVWVSAPADGAELDQLAERLGDVAGYSSGSVQLRAERLATSNVDPLVEAGWSSLLFVSFSAVLILSVVGFLVHAYVSFRGREVHFALLRTMGFSKGQLVSMVWLEQLLVIGAGLALGTWMGGRLGATIMPFLGHNDFGGQVIPPFAIQVNWGALLLTYGAMALMFAAIILALLWFIQRIALERVLRIGEM